eukprot:2403511-Alexandrium_andersonii.AAC.1
MTARAAPAARTWSPTTPLTRTCWRAAPTPRSAVARAAGALRADLVVQTPLRAMIRWTAAQRGATGGTVALPRRCRAPSGWTCGGRPRRALWRPLPA